MLLCYRKRSMWRDGIAAIVSVFVLSAPAAYAETLADALANAYRTSGLLDQNRALLRAADEKDARSVGALACFFQQGGGGGC